jgi:peptidoglycan/xylan/chitin deacetylase (PgdA/CDA1 family)
MPKWRRVTFRLPLQGRTTLAASLQGGGGFLLSCRVMDATLADGTSTGPDDAATAHRRARLTAGRRVKAALGRFVYRSGMHVPAWQDRAAIALFHRVDDRYPSDPITCSQAQFTAFCDFFARHFIVVSLTELLERLRSGADISRRLVITFDDGYRDNYHFAARELRRRGLPGCFFVATGFVGTESTAWWDAEHSIRSEWMSWDEVRALHAQGFEIGSHTIMHADCGRITGPEAAREIAGSKARLEAELGTAVQHFAYPFGDPDHMTEANLSLVRDAGFSCCLAAHGGIVSASDGVFRLRRVPINGWYHSPYQFGFETLRLTRSSRARIPQPARAASANAASSGSTARSHE